MHRWFAQLTGVMMILPILLCLFSGLSVVSSVFAYEFLGSVESHTWEQNTLTLHCEGGNRLVVSFPSQEIVRVYLDRAGKTDSLLSDALIDTRWPSAPLRLSESSIEIAVQTDFLTVRVRKSPCRLEIFSVDGTPIQLDDQTMAFGWDGNESRTWKQIAADEKFYGLGLKTGNLDKRGREWVMWNSDTPGYDNNSDPLYQSVPFFIGVRSRLAYGVFLNNSYRSRINLGAGNLRYYSLSVEGGTLDYFLIAGPEIADVVRRYSDLTGKMNLPPLWSLGYQQCRWSYYPEAEVRRIAGTFREKQIPCDAIYLDIHYMDGYRVFTWDEARFPNPEKMLSDLAQDGFKIVTIIDPGVKVDSHFAVAKGGLEHNHFVRYPDGEVYQGEVWPGPSYFPDFSSARTREWWGNQIADMRRTGVGGFWNDMNEPACWGQAFPLETVFDDDGLNSSHKKIHNLYGLLMARATHEQLVKAFPMERPFVLTRAGFAGTQRYSAAWTGDNVATFDHLELGIRMMLGMSLSGQPFIGTDIGGFMGSPSPELYARWIEVGALSPLCRTHTHYGSSDQEPWSYGEGIEEISRKFITFRYEMLPCLYGLFREASLTGEPIWRPLFYDHQDDPLCFNWNYQHQFFVGENLLVAPVTREAQYTKSVYLPEGSWLDWNTETVYGGRQGVIVNAHRDWLPMFLRDGTILIRRDAAQYVGESPIRELVLDIFCNGTSGRVEHYEDDGLSFNFQQGKYRTTEFSAIPTETEMTLVRTSIHDQHHVPDRKLLIRWHAIEAHPNSITLDGEELSRDDSTVNYDGARRLLEIRLISEKSFREVTIHKRNR